MTGRYPPSRDEILARLTGPGSRFEIRTEDVLGEPMEVFANRERSLGQLLRASARFGDREYLVTEGSRLTFRDHLDAVAALAAALREEFGVRKGDRVAICAANNPEWILTFWAATALGAVAVGMNSLWAGPEIAYGLAHSEPVLLVADAPRRALAGQPAIPVLSIEDDVPALVTKYAGAPLPADIVVEDDPAVVLYTSGTTGRPKGATHSHRNVVAACWFHLLNDAVPAALGTPLVDRRFLLVTPLFHIAALHNLAVVRLAVGDTAVVHRGRFDVDRVLRLVERERVTNWGAVPTMAVRIVEHADREGGLGAYDLSSLRTFNLGSAPSSAGLKDRIREVLPVAGRSMGTTYGLTESSTAATLAGPAELLADPDSVGRPVPTVQVEIRDVAGEPVPEGTEGEVYLRGAQMMLGYWRNPEATAASTAPHRWFRTGDLGTFVDGRLRISSRRSDLILRGGENVYPVEVENQLATHPAVRECIVLGVPHGDLGEEVTAVVVVAAGSTVTGEELREYLLGRIARYKVPSRWRVTTEELPRNATGKVNRTQVRPR
ncbi:class I adenylate-forming enzyme family protein [Blastococcus sp. BMG 814]|uniref:Class I adenylate-forming enzyme family protein n=1 Tax=Blastococcus carthaginiensis TaxID=3050034 RepID=A0ABT9I8L4_9ACTN|nr:class I adenylate-forming enzyme family protein [Blastococcus carthaginiensis]MDP5181912.1 class I adenylate-forming enzyme family protein [Blastococcus carthaginiensis]